MSSLHTIDTIHAREILNSKGFPAVEVTVTLDSGVSAIASVPSGTSTGKHEALELRDNDKDRYHGYGMLKVCNNINDEIAKALKGFDVTQQHNIDQEMRGLDGTKRLEKLGANAVLGVSLACARAAALSQDKPLYVYLRELYQTIAGSETPKDFKLPIPFFNIFNGGRHADTNLDFQEFMVVPGNVSDKFSERVRAGAEIFHSLGKVLKKHHFDTDVGAEGGYAPNVEDSMQAFDMIMEAVKAAGYHPGKEIQVGVDAGAAEFWDEKRGVYHFGALDHDMTADQLISLYADWAREYPLIYLEDGLHDDDWANWQILTEEFSHLSKEYIEKEYHHEFQVVGDDLFVTQTERLEAGISQRVGNCVITKPNQVGTLTDTMQFVYLAQKNNYQVIVSHRSGETSDDFIADFAVAVGSEFIKAGSLSRGERVTKYNRLMQIEKELG